MIRIRWNSASNSPRPSPERSQESASTKGPRIPARISVTCGVRTGRCSQARPSPMKPRAAGSRSTLPLRFRFKPERRISPPITPTWANIRRPTSSSIFRDYTHGALTATGNGLNGVFAYGAGPIFPSNVSIATADNYWVDVVFNDTSLSPQAHNDSGFAVTEDGSLSISGSALLANDSDPNGLAAFDRECEQSKHRHRQLQCEHGYSYLCAGERLRRTGDVQLHDQRYVGRHRHWPGFA